MIPCLPLERLLHRRGQPAPSASSVATSLLRHHFPPPRIVRVCRHPKRPPLSPAEITAAGGLPRPAWWDYQLPPATLATFWAILPYSLILAGVGLIESLMTLTLVDELTETSGQANRECIGQGIANMACGLLGGMGAAP